jgi:hypothetical protein
MLRVSPPIFLAPTVDARPPGAHTLFRMVK